MVYSNVVIIVLSVALLLAIGALLFGVGKFVYGIAYYYLRERKPVRTIQHSHLGLLTSDECDNTLWAGEAKTNGRNIRFLLGGSASAPDEQMVARLQRIMARYGDLERQAIEFLRNREPEIRDATLESYMLDVSDKQKPEDFTIQFLDSADDSRVWRVEFVGGEPKHTGFDD